MLIYLLLTFMLRLVDCTCGPGCLKCTSANVCQICESWSSQVLVNGTCTLQKISYCNIQSSAGTCLQCAAGYYFDLIFNACTVVPKSSLVANCQNYNSDISCGSCANGYYVYNGNCAQVTTTINSCLYYTSAIKCMTCQNQFILSSDQTACLSPPSDLGSCINFGVIACLSCNAGYIYYQNNYINIIFGNNLNGPINDASIQGMVNEYNLNYDSVNYPVCAAGNLQNCLVYNNFTSCAQCASNYFLTPTGGCQSYPAPIISACSIYTSATVCVNCSQGYFLASSISCLPVIQVPNCLFYTTNLPYTICVYCSSNYFVSSSISCTKRIKSANITNCNQTNNASDTCLVCNSTYALTDDGLSCLPSIVGCVVNLPSNVFSKSLQCFQCGPLFFLNYITLTCTTGSIANCVLYAPNSNTCLQCDPSTYLNVGSCSLLTQVASCSVYDLFSPNICRKCAVQSLLFTKDTVCYPITATITGCAQYSSPSVCTSCSDGYHLASGTCTLIATTLNCLRTSDSGLCIKCVVTYTLFTGLCQPPFTFLTQNCATSNVNGLVSPVATQCSICNVNRYAYNFRNYFMCLELAYAYEITGSTYTSCQMVDYSTTTSTYICVLCIAGFYLSPTNTCVQTCPSLKSSVTVQNFGGSSGIYTPSNANYCGTPVVANCQYQMVQSENSTSNSAVVSCVSCASGYYNLVVISDNTNRISLNATGISNGLLAQSPVDNFHIVTCVLASSMVVINSVSAVPNCEYYYTMNTLIGCVKCLFGYQGTVSTSGSGKFISACSKMSTCNVNTQLSGVSFWISSFLSCHICTDISQIPFIFVAAGTTFTDYTMNLATYDVTLAAGSWTTPTSGGFTVNCLSPKNPLYAIDLTKLPANCGIGLINVQNANNLATSSSLLISVNRANIAAVCIGCQAGYSQAATPTDSAPTPLLVPQMVGQCIIIQNCLSSTWFNYCSVCANTFVWAYLPTTGAQFNICISYPADINCLAANIINPLSPVCIYCKAGYSINLDGVCEQIAPPNCNTGQFLLSMVLPRVDFALSLYLFPLGKGCVSCNTGFISVKMMSDVYVCVTSTYLSSGNFVTGTKFIINCNQYGIANNAVVMCVLCVNGFVVSLDGTTCFANTALANCLQASSSNICANCAGGYVLVNNACPAQSILNCVSYVKSTASTQQVCISCASGYFLSNNNCLPGLIFNCANYASTATSCVGCSVGYQLVYTINNLPYCYPLPASLNCVQFIPESFQAGVLKCLTCATTDGFYRTTALASNDFPNVCLSFLPISNCTQYAVSTTASFSSFNCLNCSTGMVVSNNLCVQRTVLVANCSVYNPISNLCVQCNPQYFLAASNTQCQSFPIGLNYCRVYLNQNTCSGCASNFYYNGTLSQCLPVSLQNVVPSCLYYNSYQTCSNCTAGYVLDVNFNCQLVQAQNCLIAANTTACATCSAGRGLQNQLGLINCVAISDVRCFNYTLTYPFNCLQCIQGYYPGTNGVCVAIQTLITNCIIYGSATTCSQCSPGYVLNNYVSCSLGTIYGASFDPNCANGIIDGNLHCLSCKGGDFFVNGVCSPCKASGCYYCDPNNNNGSCLMCSSGFYMSSNGTCAKWSVTTNTTISGRVFITSVTLMWLLVWLRSVN